MTCPDDTLLPADLHPPALPRHVAVIMDGNGRWASRQGLPRMAGHRQGARTLKALLRCCKDWGIPVLTAYAFSTENWQRPLEEVSFLLRLFDRLLRQELLHLQAEGVRVRFLGDLQPLPSPLRQLMHQAMAQTQNNQAIEFNLAVNYGGHQDLVQACQKLAAQVATGPLTADQITAQQLEQALYTADLPPVDLLIRTSGEQRLSNYLLWQLAYAELYFTDTLWPDFDRADFHQALVAFQQRDRRFGGLASPRSA